MQYSVHEDHSDRRTRLVGFSATCKCVCVCLTPCIDFKEEKEFLMNVSTLVFGSVDMPYLVAGTGPKCIHGHDAYQKAWEPC